MQQSRKNELTLRRQPIFTHEGDSEDQADGPHKAIAWI